MKQTRDGDENRKKDLDVEFIGGPYDGYKESKFTEKDKLPEDVVCIICEKAFRKLEKRERLPDNSVTSIAWYKLDWPGDGRRYRFVGAVSVRNFMDSLHEP